MNLNPLWIEVRTSFTPKMILNRFKQEREKAKAHQHFPFLNILRKLPSSSQNNRFFNVFLNHSPALVGIQPPKLKGLEIEILESPSTNGAHELGLHYNILNDQLHIEISTCTDISSKDQIEEIAHNFYNLTLFFYNQSETVIDYFILKPKNNFIDGPQIDIPKNKNFYFYLYSERSFIPSFCYDLRIDCLYIEL
jgi:hypothetical protein